ncbi:MAG TPA: amino acid adenylation domain-containing protein [Gordonia sp. (in: high G+C Gram-positive bacteria)]|uniref:non-ribosomal peptide synthetase n=1 Tax=unclassified Gordonia (in: high G+C Gram-positive bacteria) TaxID=2657482 RepID=UPI000F9AAB9C|nr:MULTISPECIES: amino acid adenylation domain-containing protein [unclassified Gordonia (in: high G+C Gram-positive bacteria)]RUP37226.1 MAG: amino acid adenylation domain-containing protein [Gordonia sp. (in: high G+C Gram-positive bacteria)]HNP56284.1 amino acid adenylation domain-containing protein [Gordonia sp. (in: high G+C Gram-positive bacteria)]HRC51895.1 amino acid adenylation domain-containing protein [Gordonia sp. (in: high G+C Gram-positive bacteria)]
MSAIDELRSEVASALQVAPDEVGDTADLIELGLDSIRIMKIAGGWRKRGAKVNFAQMAQQPRLTDWAALVGGDSGSVDSDLGSVDADLGSVGDDLGSVGEGLGSVGDEAFALAPMQHAYWVGRTGAADLGGVAAHLYAEFDASPSTPIDPERLRTAVAALIDRHPMLRAQFLPDGTQRVIARPDGDPLTVRDLSSADDEQVRITLDEIRDATSHQLLDVATGRVLDVALTLLPGGRHRLHVDIDMLAADAMSYRRLLADLVALYDGEPLPAIGVTYRDYLEHRAAHPDPARDADRQWWLDRLDDLPAGPALPTSSGVVDHRVQRKHHWLDAAAKEQLLAAAHARGITPAAALAAVFAATIGAWSADPRFLLNVPLFHREPIHPDVELVSGDFSSSILLDVDVSAAASVAELAQQVQDRLHTNGSHSSYGALEVLRDLGRARGETVLAPVVYTSALGLGELFAPAVIDRLGEPGHIVSQGPQVVLDAQVTEVSGGLLLNWDVRESAFPSGVVDAMFAAYTDAIGRLAVGDVGWQGLAAPQLPAAQRAVRQQVNATAHPTSGRLLHQEFFAIAASDPTRTALLSTTSALTYGELADEALAVAGALAAAGVRAGDAVGVQLPKGPDQVVATLGVYAAGAVWIPIGYDQPSMRRTAIVETGGIGVLLTTDPAPAADDLPDGVTVLSLDHARQQERLAALAARDPEDVAYVLFTSGSTGAPKGVEVPHRAAMNTIDDVNRRFDVGPDDRSLMVAALEFDISVYDIFGLYSAGGAAIAVTPDEAKDPAAWLRLLREHRASVLTCVPSALDMLLTEAESAGAAALGDSLRAALLGGDWVGVDLPRRLHALSPQTRFAGLGGATEIAIHGTVCETVDPPQEWAAVPFGTPLDNVECRVVNALGDDCPDWVTGELWVGGAGVARGYRNDPDRTAARFVTRDGLRWYRTGDLARYWPDGTIEFLGRADHQVQVRGHRVELGEVEGALRAVDGVHQAVVVPLGDGQSVRGLAAVVTLSTPRHTSESLAAAVGALVPSYMVPARIEIVDAMPLTGNGKLDRAAVGAVLSQGAASSGHIAPSTALQRALCDIVATVLAREVAEISVADDFFAIGGDSVLATTVVARIREWLDAPQAGIADVFAARTVADLAVRLDAADARPGRLEQVAAVYLEVAALDDDELDEAAAHGAGIDSGVSAR